MRSYILLVFFGMSAIDWLISLMSFSLVVTRKEKKQQTLIVLGSGEIGGPCGARTDQRGGYRKCGPVGEDWEEEDILVLLIERLNRSILGRYRTSQA